MSKIENLQKKLIDEAKHKKKVVVTPNKNDSRKIIELYEKLEMKEKEIKDLKKIIENNSNNYNNLMTVIFYSTELNIHYSLICKETDSFSVVENKLYDVYPECKEYEYFFLANEQKIKRFKTLQENKIKNSQLIYINSEWIIINNKNIYLK